LYSRFFNPVKHQPSPSNSINIVQQTALSLSWYRREKPITTIDIEEIYGTNILQTRLVEGETRPFKKVGHGDMKGINL
jgi:hypothetical protein